MTAKKDHDADAPETEADAHPAEKQMNDRVAKEQAQGFRGVATDPIPNSEYSLASGPDSPKTASDTKTRLHQPVLPDEVNY